MPDRTLQIYIDDIYFDRPTLAVMWGYVVTFVRPNVDGDVQMYMSPASMRVVRIDRPGQPDLVHRFDGNGLMIASLPAKNLESVTITAFFIRDSKKQREAGVFLEDLLKEQPGGVDLLSVIEPLIAKLPKVGGLASTLLRIPRSLGLLLSKVLRARHDTIKIYADGSQKVADLDEDFTMRWGVGHGDKGFFNTTWDFCMTNNPSAVVSSLEIPPWLMVKLGLEK